MMKEISKSNVFEVSINEKDKKKINGGRVTRSYINKCSEIVKRLEEQLIGKRWQIVIMMILTNGFNKSFFQWVAKAVLKWAFGIILLKMRCHLLQFRYSEIWEIMVGVMILKGWSNGLTNVVKIIGQDRQLCKL